MTEISFIESLGRFEATLESEDAFVLYFNTNTCTVGEALAPKISSLLEAKYAKMKMFHVDSGAHPEIAAQLSVFVFPTILFFFGGKESLRKTRHFSMAEVDQAIARPYELLFG